MPLHSSKRISKTALLTRIPADAVLLQRRPGILGQDPRHHGVRIHQDSTRCASVLERQDCADFFRALRSKRVLVALEGFGAIAAVVVTEG